MKIYVMGQKVQREHSNLVLRGGTVTSTGQKIGTVNGHGLTGAWVVGLRLSTVRMGLSVFACEPGTTGRLLRRAWEGGGEHGTVGGRRNAWESTAGQRAEEARGGGIHGSNGQGRRARRAACSKRVIHGMPTRKILSQALFCCFST